MLRSVHVVGSNFIGRQSFVDAIVFALIAMTKALLQLRPIIVRPLYREKLQFSVFNARNSIDSFVGKYGFKNIRGKLEEKSFYDSVNSSGVFGELKPTVFTLRRAIKTRLRKVPTRLVHTCTSVTLTNFSFLSVSINAFHATDARKS